MKGRVVGVEVGEKPGQALCEHGLAGARGAHEEQVVAAGRCDLEARPKLQGAVVALAAATGTDLSSAAGDPIKGKRVFVAGHRGMVGLALLNRLAREECTVITAPPT